MVTNIPIGGRVLSALAQKSETVNININLSDAIDAVNSIV